MPEATVPGRLTAHVHGRAPAARALPGRHRRRTPHVGDQRLRAVVHAERLRSPGGPGPRVVVQQQPVSGRVTQRPPQGGTAGDGGDLHAYRQQPTGQKSSEQGFAQHPDPHSHGPQRDGAARPVGTEMDAGECVVQREPGARLGTSADAAGVPAGGRQADKTGTEGPSRRRAGRVFRHVRHRVHRSPIPTAKPVVSTSDRPGQASGNVATTPSSWLPVKGCARPDSCTRRSQARAAR